MIWNPGAETMTADERRALQLARLRETVRWTVERVPVIRARVGTPEIRSLDDLQALPFTRKTDLREHYPFGLFAVPRTELARIHASSGTKGKPTVVGYTAGDLDVWREVMARVMVAAGARPGHTLHNAYGYGLFTGGLGFHDGGERIGMTVVPVSSGNTARHQMLLQDFRPDGLGATPSFALHIGESLLAAGRSPARARPEVRDVRRRAVDRRAAARARARVGLPRVRRVRPVGDHRTRRRRRVRGARGVARRRTITSCRRSWIPRRARRAARARKGSSW